MCLLSDGGGGGARGGAVPGWLGRTGVDGHWRCGRRVPAAGPLPGGEGTAFHCPSAASTLPVTVLLLHAHRLSPPFRCTFTVFHRPLAVLSLPEARQSLLALARARAVCRTHIHNRKGKRESDRATDFPPRAPTTFCANITSGGKPGRRHDKLALSKRVPACPQVRLAVSATGRLPSTTSADGSGGGCAASLHVARLPPPPPGWRAATVKELAALFTSTGCEPGRRTSGGSAVSVRLLHFLCPSTSP